MTCAQLFDWFWIVLSTEIDGKQISNKSKELKQVQEISSAMTLLIHSDPGQVILLLYVLRDSCQDLAVKVIRNASAQIKLKTRPYANVNSMVFIW